MNLAQMDLALRDFKSPFETIGFIDVNDSIIQENMTLSFSSNKQFYTYLAQVHSKEPIASGSSLDLLDQSIDGFNYKLTWREFNALSYINKVYTLEFVANTLVPPPALVFIDKSMLGDRNEYKPFGSTDSKSITTHLTEDVAGMSEFYLRNFKHKNFRGTIVFNSATYYAKGTIIDISDKDIKVVIIEFKLNLEGGFFAYTGLVLAKGI